MWLERTITLVTIAGAVAGSMIWMNDHYASAADMKSLEKTLKKDSLESRIKDKSDRIFELEFKQRSNPRDFKPIDAALLERFKSDLKELQDKARDIDR